MLNSAKTIRNLLILRIDHMCTLCVSCVFGTETVKIQKLEEGLILPESSDDY